MCIRDRIGTPIQAIADGVVTTATEQGGAYGVYVVIRHEIDGQVVESAYAHMREGSLALGCVKLRRRSLCGFQAAVAVWA